MISLLKSLTALGTSNIKHVLKAEIESLTAGYLPLQQGLSKSSYVGNRPFSVMVISILEEADFIRVKTGIFYNGVIAGCNCADDPGPVDEQAEYCVVGFVFDKMTAEIMVRLLSE